MLSWLPKYLSSEYGVDTKDSGLLLLPVYLLPFVASNASGQLADWMLRAGQPVRKIRVLMQCVAFIGPAVCLMLLGSEVSGSTAVAVVLMAGALGFGAFSHSGFWANIIGTHHQFTLRVPRGLGLVVC